MTYGARVSVTWERGCDEVYVFVYACSWAQSVSIRILWHICVTKNYNGMLQNRRIVMVFFIND